MWVNLKQILNQTSRALSTQEEITMHHQKRQEQVGAYPGWEEPSNQYIILDILFIRCNDMFINAALNTWWQLLFFQKLWLLLLLFVIH